MLYIAPTTTRRSGCYHLPAARYNTMKSTPEPEAGLYSACGKVLDDNHYKWALTFSETINIVVCKHCNHSYSHTVSVEPLRQRFSQLRDEGVPVRVMMARIGWDMSQWSRFMRLLGVMQHTSGGRIRIKQSVSIRNAELLCVALDVDPVEVGI